MNVEALHRLLTLVSLLQKATEAMGEVAQVIKEAQDDGRDLSEEEIEIVRSRTDNALEELRRLK